MDDKVDKFFARRISAHVVTLAVAILMASISNGKFWSTFALAAGGVSLANLPLLAGAFLIIVLFFNACLTIASFRYDVQEAAYRSGYRQAVGAPAEMMFIVVETEPPHEVGVYTIDAEDVEAADGHWRHALNLYKTHTATGQWPGYTDTEPQTLVLPAWHRRR